jgi:hypothetical protein
MKITAHPDGLVIEMQGIEVLWTLRKRLVIPRNVISSIEYIDQKPPQNFALPFIKFPGTVWPRILMAGTFIKRGEKDFWYLRVRHDGMISIMTKPGRFNYNRVLLSCDDQTANDIGRWWKA